MPEQDDPCTVYPRTSCTESCDTFCKRFPWTKPHKIFNGRSAMPNRECEVWAVHKKWYGRIIDFLWYGHSKHVCSRFKPFAQEHKGDHKCNCGLVWPKQSTDND